MARNQLIQARIDPSVKEEAAAVLAAMGLTVSDAVRLLLAHRVRRLRPVVGRVPARARGWYDPRAAMFKLITTVRGGAVNNPAVSARYASVDDAKEAAKVLMHEHQRVVRVMIVEEPSRFVEWLDRS